MKLWTVVAAALFVALSGCGKDENQDRIDAILALTGDPVAGEPVYQATCASCHNTDATGGTGPSLVGNTDTETMVSQILAGGETMPPQGGLLTDQEVADIVAWTQSL